MTSILQPLENRTYESFSAREWRTYLFAGEPTYPRFDRWYQAMRYVLHPFRHAWAEPMTTVWDFRRDVYILVRRPGLRTVEAWEFSGQLITAFKPRDVPTWEFTRALAKRIGHRGTRRVRLP